VRDGLLGLIGNTPLIRLRKASELTGCTILGKAEFMNPGGSVKDRAALYFVRDAEARGELEPGGLIVEGTAGNTGIGLAIVGNSLGYRTLIVIPQTQSQEKKDALRLLGAELREVAAVPYDEALPVLFDLLRAEGLCLGGSSGINVAGAIRLARQLGPGHTIVTILADSGTRYQSKLYNPTFLREKNLPVPAWLG